MVIVYSRGISFALFILQRHESVLIQAFLLLLSNADSIPHIPSHAAGVKIDHRQ